VVFFGTYDLDKPRNRQLLEALRRAGFEVREVHFDVWKGVADKAMLTRMAALRRVLRWICAYPFLIARYLSVPSHDIVIVGYLGHLDVLILRPFAWLRRVPVMWDVFLSIYDTVICDRGMLRHDGIAASVVWGWEWLACRCADRLLIDTTPHAEYLCELYGLAPSRVAAIFVGAEAEKFRRLEPPKQKEGDQVQVLFYGQFIPLHGIATIIEAARIDQSGRICWHLVGRGQERSRISALVAQYSLSNIIWEEWVPYQTLIDRIEQADVCLGIFGSSGKAGRVIPNKVFQILAAGRPLVTRDSPAIRELVGPDTPGIRLVPPDDPEALLSAILDLADSREIPSDELSNAFSIDRISHDLRRLTMELCGCNGLGDGDEQQ